MYETLTEEERQLEDKKEEHNKFKVKQFICQLCTKKNNCEYKGKLEEGCKEFKGKQSE